MDPVDRDMQLWQQSKVSVKQNETGFVVGAAKGSLASVGETLAGLGELLSPKSRSEGLQESVSWWLKNTLLGDNPKPGEAAGYDAGNVIGNVSQLVTDPLAPIAGGILKANLLPVGKIAKGVVPKLHHMLGKTYHEVSHGNLTPNLSLINEKIYNGLDPRVSLKDFYFNPELESALPGFHDKVKVAYDENYFLHTKSIAGMSPIYDKATGELKDLVVYLRPSYWDDKPLHEMRPTLIHETQHAIQGFLNQESFGTNPKATATKLKRALEKRGETVPENLNNVALHLYMTNRGEQEAESAARLSQGWKPDISESLIWNEDFPDELYTAYKKYMAGFK